MKKAFPYIVGSIALLLLLVMLLANKTRRLDERITLRQGDKIPYGTAVAKHLLPSLFPNAEIFTDARYPGSWDDIDANGSNQAVIFIADYMDADNGELEQLVRFAGKGNTVFIIARALSDVTATFFSLRTGSDAIFFRHDTGSLRVRLNNPPFVEDSFFVYPGKKYDGHFYQLDKRAISLGYNIAGSVNFIETINGGSSLFLHASPLAFSNYFILHKQNIRYYQQVLSVIPPNTKAVLWNEYFLHKQTKAADKKNPNWLGALFNVPAFTSGFLTASLFLLLFVLLGMRRNQRVIPPHEKPTNESLIFVQTLGRLYYDKGDHSNLAEKMSAYFLEHVRSTYKMATHTLDEEFVTTLHVKSGYPLPDLNNIVTAIKGNNEPVECSEERLAYFHQQLELFYQNT